MHRRDFLKATLAGVALPCAVPSHAAESGGGMRLSIASRTLDVNGRAASVFSLTGPDGRSGLVLDAEAGFDVGLVNASNAPTIIHWHGLTPPWREDGVPDSPAPLLDPGETRAYRFPLGTGGTHWMHAHTLQEQSLLAAPLIVRTAEDRAADEQDVVMMLHDFSFTPPEELLAGLRGESGAGADAMGMMGHGSMGHGMHGAPDVADGGDMPMADMGHGAMEGMGNGVMGAMGAMDINDIEYDAYLANDRTLADPEVVPVERGGTVRLRIINGAASTGFIIDLGSLEGTLIAVDGQPVVPVTVRRVPLAMAQRADIRLRLPVEPGAFPVLALREGARERTGIVLATPGASVTRMPELAEDTAPVIDLSFEARLQAASPLSLRRPDSSHMVHLSGTMDGYRWAMMGHETIAARRGERIEVSMMNMSMMAHPMHLHGHHFQVVAIDGQRVAGAMRDTVHIPPMRTVTVAVDANNPGYWAFHCHHLYHMVTGMMGTFAYRSVA